MFISWKPLSLNSSATLKDALKLLDATAKQIILVIDDHDRLLGTLTDGDIRRALLRDTELSERVTHAMNVEPIVGIEGEHSLAWRQKLKGKKVRHLPVLNSVGQIIGLYYDQPISLSGLPYPVVLMLGGLGTRLRPLTQSVPKPMLKVGNRPILEHIMEALISQGFAEFYFCINYLGHMIRDYFGSGEKWGVKIYYVEESKRMGTAGALSLLPHSMQTPFVVMNGDLLTKIDFKALIDFHVTQRAVATMCVREHEHQVPYGVIQCNNYQIVGVVEKPVYRYWVSAGIYVLSPETLSFVPKNEFYDMPTLIDQLIAQQLTVSAHKMQDYWLDIGQMPDFEQAQADYDAQFLLDRK